MVDLPGKALTRDAKGSLRFIVYAAGWLKFMVIHGRGCCSCHMHDSDMFFNLFAKVTIAFICIESSKNTNDKY